MVTRPPAAAGPQPGCCRRRSRRGVQHQPTARAHMRPHPQRLLHPHPARCPVGQDPATVLGCVGRRHGHHRDTAELTVIAEPVQEEAPGGIVDALGKTAVLGHIGDPHVFVGDQIVRLDQRSRRLTGEVFPLPTNFQIPLGQVFPRLLPVLRPLLYSAKRDGATALTSAPPGAGSADWRRWLRHCP
jgi:hypothetical protein